MSSFLKSKTMMLCYTTIWRNHNQNYVLNGFCNSQTRACREHIPNYCFTMNTVDSCLVTIVTNVSYRSLLELTIRYVCHSLVETVKFLISASFVSLVSSCLICNYTKSPFSIASVLLCQYLN